MHSLSDITSVVRQPRFFTSDNPHAPAPEFPFRHCVPLQIRFTDIDSFGHLNNNVYMSMLDIGKLSYYNTVLGGSLDYADIPAVVVNVNCSFLAQTYIDEAIEVWTAAAKLGKHSFTIEQRIVNSDTGEVKCAARTILCAIGPDHRTAPVPDLWAEAISQFEHRKFDNK